MIEVTGTKKAIEMLNCHLEVKQDAIATAQDLMNENLKLRKKLDRCRKLLKSIEDNGIYIAEIMESVLTETKP